MALAVPLSRFTSRVGGGSAFFVRPLHTIKTIRTFLVGIAVFVGIAGCSTPSPKVASSRPRDNTTTATVEDARLLYETGKLDDAWRKLQAVLEIEPDNQKAQYYLALVHHSQELSQNQPPTARGYYQTIPQQPIY